MRPLRLEDVLELLAKFNPEKISTKTESNYDFKSIATEELDSYLLIESRVDKIDDMIYETEQLYEIEDKNVKKLLSTSTSVGKIKFEDYYDYNQKRTISIVDNKPVFDTIEDSKIVYKDDLYLVYESLNKTHLGEIMDKCYTVHEINNNTIYSVDIDNTNNDVYHLELFKDDTEMFLHLTNNGDYEVYHIKYKDGKTEVKYIKELSKLFDIKEILYINIHLFMNKIQGIVTTLNDIDKCLENIETNKTDRYELYDYNNKSYKIASYEEVIVDRDNVTIILSSKDNKVITIENYKLSPKDANEFVKTLDELIISE